MSDKSCSGSLTPTTVAVPILQTDRLILSGHRLEDFADCLALWSDPVVTRHITGRPSTAEEVWARILRYVGHWAALGYGFWQLRERASGRFVGEVGLADFRRDLSVGLDGVAEAGWVLAPWAHGQGYAHEAMAAALTWAADHGHARTMCIIDPDNASSLRLAARLGYREHARAPYHGSPIVALVREPGPIDYSR